ncbi:MAG: RluA family pseudouridine synthase [Firmicutes bacterium]|nr:RluA family pseudouridine synthase [Bacillota bacterium]
MADKAAAGEKGKTAEVLECVIPSEMDGIRLDKVLSETYDGLSRSYIQKLFEQGCIEVGGEVCTEKKTGASAGQPVRVLLPEPARLNVEGENIPLDIVYEDEAVLVVNKPAGMVVHPAPGSPSGTLVNALIYRYGDQLSSINGVLRPGIVHRIDKDTSGLLMVARDDQAHESLSRQLAAHTITRRYRAIVCDNIREDSGTIDRPIGRDPRNRLRNAVTAGGGKRAVTHYRVLERFGRYTLVEAVLETGRTHQIRVHMAYIHHPLLGDSLYGSSAGSTGARRQMLHAGILGFKHPRTSAYLEFEAPLPEDFETVLERLRTGRR